LDANELKTIGVALKSDMITPAYAVQWLIDIAIISQVRGAALINDTGLVIDGDTGEIISGK